MVRYYTMRGSLISSMMHVALLALIIYANQTTGESKPQSNTISVEIVQDTVSVDLAEQVEKQERTASQKHTISNLKTETKIKPTEEKLAKNEKKQEIHKEQQRTEQRPRLSLVAEEIAVAGKGDNKARYVDILAAWLEKYKIYPHTARQQGMEGSGVLSLTINDDGRVIQRSIKTSTGSRELDRAMIHMASNASPVPKPEGYYNSQPFDIAVNFKLR